MGAVKELIDLIKSTLNFCTIVYEWEKGLFIDRGVVIPKRVRLFGEKLEEIVKEEEPIISEHGGRWKLFCDAISGKKHQFPEGYRTNWLGLPKHKDRYEKSKNLNAGIYIHFPLVQEVVTANIQEDLADLREVGVLTTDDKPVAMQISPNIRFEILNFYKLYTRVKEYKKAMGIHTLSTLARCCRGTKFMQWTDDKFISELEKGVLKQVREIMTEDWGLKISEIRLTHTVPATYQNIVYKGNIPGPQPKDSQQSYINEEQPTEIP